MKQGKGWHLEPVRHSRARRFGSAGGKMPKKFKTNNSPFADWNKGKVSFSDLKKDDSVYNYSEADEIADAQKQAKAEEIEKDYNAVSKHEYQTHDFNKMVDLTSINEAQAKKLKVGDVVVVPADLTSDPYNKRGEAGVIQEIQPMGKFDPLLKVKFKDGSTGLYDSTAMLYSNSANENKNKTPTERIRIAYGLPAKPIPQKWFIVGKDLKEIAIQKPSKKKIDSLNKKGFAVSRITEIDGKTEIFTFSPRTREEAIKQENRLFG